MDGVMRAGVAGWLVEAREFGECQARASREPVDGSRERPLRDGGNGAIEGAGPSTSIRKVSDPPAQDRRRGEVSSGGDEMVRGSEDRMRQLPTVQVLNGGDSEAAAKWDAHAEEDIGAMIERYLSSAPAPPGSSCSEPFGRWARQLRQSGLARREALGEPQLRAL